jgi:hypothetical protein
MLERWVHKGPQGEQRTKWQRLNVPEIVAKRLEGRPESEPFDYQGFALWPAWLFENWLDFNSEGDDWEKIGLEVVTEPKKMKTYYGRYTNGDCL